jgi:hypothetical protein
VHTWGCQGIEQLFLDVTPPEEEGKQEGAASVEETFMDGPVLGWSLCPKQAVVTMSYVLKMQKGFFEDLFESVQSLEHLRVIRWNSLKFVRTSRYLRGASLHDQPLS